jgi:hypothetical protein
MNAVTAIVENQSFAYIETTIEPGVTIAEFRAARPKQPSRWRRLVEGMSLSGRRQVAAA